MKKMVNRIQIFALLLLAVVVILLSLKLMNENYEILEECYAALGCELVIFACGMYRLIKETPEK